jgi:hypothetical protein
VAVAVVLQVKIMEVLEQVIQGAAEAVAVIHKVLVTVVQVVQE